MLPCSYGNEAHDIATNILVLTFRETSNLKPFSTTSDEFMLLTHIEINSSLTEDRDKINILMHVFTQGCRRDIYQNLRTPIQLSLLEEKKK